MHVPFAPDVLQLSVKRESSPLVTGEAHLNGR